MRLILRNPRIASNASICVRCVNSLFLRRYTCIATFCNIPCDRLSGCGVFSANGFLCRRTASTEHAANRAQAAAVDQYFSSQTENISVTICLRTQTNILVLWCTLGLRKFRHSKSSVYRWYPLLVRGRFVYDTYRTVEATRSRHGWVHMFMTHFSTVTLSNFITSICSGLVVQVVSALLRGNGKISTDTTHRAVPR